EPTYRGVRSFTYSKRCVSHAPFSSPYQGTSACLDGRTRGSSPAPAFARRNPPHPRLAHGPHRRRAPARAFLPIAIELRPTGGQAHPRLAVRPRALHGAREIRPS